VSWNATDWSAVASGAAAVGTLALAGVTWRLAKSTAVAATKSGEMSIETGRLADLGERELEVVRDQAVATSEQARASADTLRLAQRPLLVPVVDARFLDDLRITSLDGMTTSTQMGAEAKCWQEGSQPNGRPGAVWAVIPVRNVGPGTARIDDEPSSVFIQAPTLYGGALFSSVGRPSSRIVAVGDVVYLTFRAEDRQPSSPSSAALRPEEQGSTALVVVRYSDISGGNRTRSRFAYRYFTPPTLRDAVVTVEPTDLEASAP
jgi:hypothetical protein